MRYLMLVFLLAACGGSSSTCDYCPAAKGGVYTYLVTGNPDGGWTEMLVCGCGAQPGSTEFRTEIDGMSCGQVQALGGCR